MTPLVEYIADHTIDDALDAELRELLTLCFTNPQDVVFETQRYFCEPYPNRWVMRDERGRLVAHVGLHEKTVEADGRVYRVGGVAEVCVHPEHRGKRYVGTILQQIHEWLQQHGFEFSVLFGETYVYRSSGYQSVNNLFHEEGDGVWKLAKKMMVKELTETGWPNEVARLSGRMF